MLNTGGILPFLPHPTRAVTAELSLRLRTSVGTRSVAIRPLDYNESQTERHQFAPPARDRCVHSRHDASFQQASPATSASGFASGTLVAVVRSSSQAATTGNHGGGPRTSPAPHLRDVPSVPSPVSPRPPPTFQHRVCVKPMHLLSFTTGRRSTSRRASRPHARAGTRSG